MTDKPTYVYVTYIKTSAEKVWQALTDGEITRQYWGDMHNVSDWKVGSEWRHVQGNDVFGVGRVIESDRPRRLVVSWGLPADADDPAKHDRVTFDIVEDQGVVRLTVMNVNVEPGSDSAEAWPKVLCGLKTLLETGEALPPFWGRDGAEWRNLRFA